MSVARVKVALLLPALSGTRAESLAVLNSAG